jgi:hypothetical protein
MRLFTYLLVSTTLLFSAAKAQEPAAASKTQMPCVEVQIGQDRTAQMNCLNESLRRTVEREHNKQTPEAPITARSGSTQVGTANVAAAQQMMGDAYGVSSVPQRPHSSFASPLVRVPH